MKNFITLTSALLLLFFAFSCKNGESNASVAAALSAKSLPKTPEDVVKTWENQVGQNLFADAKLISTGKALETVVSLDSSNAIQHIAATSSKILTIDCKTEGDKSKCDCLLEDAVGQLKCTYFLVQQNGQWYLQDAESAPVEPVEIPKSTVNKKPERLVK
jgi:hypothetical protein